MPATISVDIALTTAPTAAPAWTSVTDYVESFSIRRGRQGPLETAGAGSATLRLTNQDRRFDPRHTTGPYYGTLKPMRRLRIRATWNAITYDLFHGYVSGWPQSRENYGTQTVTLSCSDAFKVFQLAEVNGAFALQRSDERIAAVLGASGWVTGQGWMLGDATHGVLGTTTKLGPVGDRALDQGKAQVQAVTLADTQALSHIQAVEQSENGYFFVGKSGEAVFHSRHRRLVAGSGASSATFGDNLTTGSEELPYVSATLDYDDQQIYNDVRVTRTDGIEQVATDSASKLDYFKRSYSRSVLVPTDSEALSIATYLKNTYKDPQYRITSLVLDPEYDTGQVYPQMLGRELGDVVTVRATPLGGGSRIEQVSFIEGMAIDWTAAGGAWGGEWQLSQADTNTYWLLGKSTLGVNTALAYAVGFFLFAHLLASATQLVTLVAQV